MSSLERDAANSSAGERMDLGAFWEVATGRMSIWDWLVAVSFLMLSVALALWLLSASARWTWKGAYARRVWLVQAAFWASTSRPLMPRVGYQEHEWSILGREYEAEMMFCYSGSGSGKSSRLVIPLIVRRLRRRRVSIVVMDPKGEQLRWSWPWLGLIAGRPPVHLLSTLPRHRRKAVPIDVFATPTMRRRYLRGVFGAQDAKESFWLDAAVEMWDEVADVLGDADLITTWLVLRDPSKLDELAERCEGVRRVWAGSHLKGSHQEIRTNAVVPFAALKEERVRRLFDRGRLPAGSAGGPTFAEREMVYVCVTHDDTKTAGALFAGLMAELQHRAVDRREGAPNVEIVADEAGTCYPLRELETYINICRGAGVNIALFLQSYGQAVVKLGAEAADDVTGAAELQVFGPTANVATRRRLEELSGTAYLPQPGCEEPTLQPIVRGDELGKIRKGTFYVVHAAHRPEKVTQRARWPRYAHLILPARSKRDRPNMVVPSAANLSNPPQHRRDEEREEAMPKGREAARREAIEHARAKAEAGRQEEDAPSDDDAPGVEPPASNPVSNGSAESEGLVIRNGQVMQICAYCTSDYPAQAEECPACKPAPGRPQKETGRDR